MNQTNIVDDKNSSASFNYEFDNRTVVEKPTIPPQLLNVSIGEQQELEEVTKEIIEATTTANTKIKKIITNTTGTEFTWEVFEEDGNAKSGADAKTGADAKGEVGARNEADENDIVPTTTQEPDEMIQILQASGPYNFSIEGTPVSLAQTMRDTLQYMRNANPAIRHQLFRRYKIKRQPIKGSKCT